MSIEVPSVVGLFEHDPADRRGALANEARALINAPCFILREDLIDCRIDLIELIGCGKASPISILVGVSPFAARRYFPPANAARDGADNGSQHSRQRSTGRLLQC
jgi:hypothetical protein